MRKFKLIKEYPCSGKLGTIKEWDGKDVICFNMPAYPEYWEEVKEEFPKIISFRSKYSKDTYSTNYTLKKDGKFWYSTSYSSTLESLLTHPHYEICKVAVSETEIFTLGDKVTYNYKANYAPWVIDNFLLRSDGKILARSKSNSICEIVSEIKKALEPLFVTEDSKEIYPGDTYFSVRLDTLEILKPNENWVSSLKLIKYFSTKEAAEKYIDENKPVYSKKQIKEAVLISKEGSPIAVSDEGFVIISKFNEDTFKQKLGL